MTRPSDTLTPPVVDIPDGFKDPAPSREIEEFPSLGDSSTLAVGLLMLIAVVGYCVVMQS